MKNTIDGLTDKIEQVRHDAADSIENAADSVRSTSKQGREVIDDLAQGAAKRMDATAKMVRDYDPAGSLRKIVRENPGTAVCTGVAVGLLVGLVMRRN